MGDVLGDVLARRRDRAIAAILGVKEREVDRYLPEDVSRRLRKVVLDQLNDYWSMAVDVLESMDDHSPAILNDLWLARIAQIHEAVVGNGNGNGNGVEPVPLRPDPGR